MAPSPDPPPMPDAPAWLRRLGVLAALIAATTVLAYLPALRGGLLWDDDAHVTRPELRSLHGLARIWTEIGATQQYYPVLHSAFWIEHRLWGDSPAAYHAVTIALHALNAVLVLAVVRRLLRGRGVAWADEASLLAAAIFALHPVHAESVAWISEQKNTLSAAFYLGAMLAYLRFDRTRERASYALATALFVLALLTKPVTVTLPAALLVVLWWERGRPIWRSAVLPLAPWFALAAASGLLAAWVERSVIGAQGERFGLTGAQRLLLPGRAVLFYLCKLLWPSDLIFVYPRWDVDPAVWWQWLYPAGAIALVLAAIVAARRTRAPLTALLFFVGTLFPVLGFFNVYLFQYTFVADHFQYLASLGVITLAAGAGARAAAAIPSRAARTAVLLIVPLALAGLTFRQCTMYGDIQTLYETTIQRNPSCWMAHNNLGIELKRQGRLGEAIDHYRRALALNPTYPEALNNLGVALDAAGRHTDAVAALEESLRARPRYPDAMANLVAALTDAGRARDAIDRGFRLIAVEPRYARLRMALGVALGTAGQHRDGAEQFEEAVRLEPDLVEARLNLAVSYEALGRSSDALAEARLARSSALRQGQDAVAQTIDAWIAARAGRAPPPPR